jgi:DNA polymerase III delta prime subunit
MNNKPWIQKYEPTKLEDMVLNVRTRKRLEFVANNICSAILHGPPGTGKNTFMNVLKEQAQRENTMYHYYWFNAGKDGGIDIVREKVHHYVIHGRGGYEFQGFTRRYVVFNEAEKLTKDAQIVLREIQEKYYWINFIFMCNDFSKIDLALKSRFIEVKMENPSTGDAINFVRKILAAENIEVDGIPLSNLVGKATIGGRLDMRKLIMELEIETATRQ